MADTLSYTNYPKFEYVKGQDEPEPPVATLNKPTAYAGITIRRHRITQMLSQVELAERLKVSNSYMSMVETGGLVPSRAFIYRASQALNVPYADLVVEPVHLQQLRIQLADVADQDVFDAFDILSRERRRTT